jgi:O-antigen ligase
MKNGFSLKLRLFPYLLIGTVVMSPLPFGSTDQISVAFWVVILAVVSIGVLPARFTSAQLIFVACAAAIALAWATTMYIGLSTSPIFAGALDNPIWRQASEALQVQLHSGVSVTRNQPFYSAGPQLACFLALFAGFMAGHDQTVARRFLQVVSISAVVYAGFGIVSFAIDPNVVLWREKLAYRSFLTATFTNRNTAAIYFGSFAVIWLLILTNRLSKVWPADTAWLHAAKATLRRPGFPAVRAAFSLLLVLSAMFMTGSRAGVLMSLAAMFGALLAFHRSKLSSVSALAGALVIGGAVLLALLQLMGTIVANRFDLNDLAENGRWHTYKSTLAIIVDFPWFGTGLGTFPIVFPAYRSSEISTFGTWDRAHNTLLELASEQGIPFAIIVTTGFAVMGIILVRGIRRRRRDRIIPLSALSVAVLVVAHSLVDFSLQIPALAILVFTLIGVGLAQSYSATVLASRSPLNSSGCS